MRPGQEERGDAEDDEEGVFELGRHGGLFGVMGWV
jgi:hypothetical protein